MDPQSNTTIGLGINKDELEYSIYEILTHRSKGNTPLTIEDVIFSCESIKFLDIVPATNDLAGAEIELVNTIARERQLDLALEPVRGRYDYIIIDAPPSLGILTINILTAADSVLIPIQCEYYALEGLAELLNTIRLVQKSLNKKLVIEGALLTMYDNRLNLSKQVAEDVRSYLGDKVFKAVINRNVKLGEAPSFGKPIILYDIMSSGSENYLTLAKEIMQHE